MILGFVLYIIYIVIFNLISILPEISIEIFWLSDFLELFSFLNVFFSLTMIIPFVRVFFYFELALFAWEVSRLIIAWVRGSK